jgi:AcrR family transcriptional regulator
MPRQPDLEVEGHVLDAAYRLWRSKGERGLTMRAVAREAGTTTPTVYQRFKDKREILEALRLRAQLQLFAAVKGSRAVAQFCRRYLDSAASHKHEYELIHADWSARLHRDEPRPSLELLQRRLEDCLGGKPKIIGDDASDCGAIARDRDAIADSRGAGERGEGTATDLLDGGGEFGGVCAEEWVAEQGMTYRSECSPLHCG